MTVVKLGYPVCQKHIKTETRIRNSEHLFNFFFSTDNKTLKYYFYTAGTGIEKF